MNKPVIILGGGLWGCLLAYKLKESLPEVDFILYEESSMLGRHEAWTFRESDCPKALKWLKPLISKSWHEHRVKLGQGEKAYHNPFHLIDSRHLHELLLEKLPAQAIRLNNRLRAGLALQESSFVIDTRDICHFKKAGYKKYLTVEIELQHDHGVVAPVLFNKNVKNKDGSRVFSYFPLSSKVLLINDYWFSSSKVLNVEQMREALNETMTYLGWKVKKIIREESGVTVVPTSEPLFRQEGRVINLAGLFHDTTGSSIGHATRLIEKMVNTSFRFGELREVVNLYRSEIENDRKFLRYINKMLTEDKPGHLFEMVHEEPFLLERFSRGELNFFDRSKIVLNKISSGLLPLESHSRLESRQ